MAVAHQNIGCFWMIASLLNCRVCGAAELSNVFSLGSQPLANSLEANREAAMKSPVFPLDLMLCRACTTVQLRETIDPATLFADYMYRSSISKLFLGHVNKLVDTLIKQEKVTQNDLVLEIGSNDGYLLQFYKKHQIRTIGFEPASNIAEIARRVCKINVIEEYFCARNASAVRDDIGRAKIVHAHNVLAHTDNPHDIAAGIKIVLDTDGIAVLEVPYLLETLNGLAFDTIYHEHVFYFSLRALCALFDQHELDIYDVKQVAVHGGSVQVYLCHKGHRQRTSHINNMLHQEKQNESKIPQLFAEMARSISRNRDVIKNIINQSRARGENVVGYGAAAKATVLLNYFGINNDDLMFVADQNLLKQNNWIPGVAIPIVSPAVISDEGPAIVLILAWNLVDEVFQQLKTLHGESCEFIVPVPTPCRLNANGVQVPL